MLQPVRVAVFSGTFCINCNCGCCEIVHRGGKSDYVDCRRADCDNHKRLDNGPRMPDEPPFPLPEGDVQREFRFRAEGSPE